MFGKTGQNSAFICTIRGDRLNDDTFCALHGDLSETAK
jgi:hypothetical protein